MTYGSLLFTLVEPGKGYFKPTKEARGVKLSLKPSEVDNIMKEVFDLQDINDTSALRAEVERRMASMNTIERTEVNMRIGRKIEEAEARTRGTKYSPPSWALFLTSILFFVLAGGSAYIVFCTKAWLAFKVSAGILGVLWLLMSWRSVSRVIHRLRNRHDQ